MGVLFFFSLAVSCVSVVGLHGLACPLVCTSTLTVLAPTGTMLLPSSLRLRPQDPPSQTDCTFWPKPRHIISQSLSSPPPPRLKTFSARRRAASPQLMVVRIASCRIWRTQVCHRRSHERQAHHCREGLIDRPVPSRVLLLLRAPVPVRRILVLFVGVSPARMHPRRSHT